MNSKGRGMKKHKKVTIFLGGIALSLAVVLGFMAFDSNAFAKNEIGKYENKDLADKVVAYDDDGNEKDASKIDESLYEGYMFRLTSDAPDTYHSKQALKETAGTITYNEKSKLYSAESLEAIDDFVDEKYIEYIEPDYIVTLSMNEESESNSGSDYSVSADSDKTADAGDGDSDNGNDGDSGDGSDNDEGSNDGTEYSANPNDTHYQNGNLWNLTMMGVEGAWENGLFGESREKDKNEYVTVAVIDSGLYGTGSENAKHEDINYDNVEEGVNLINAAVGTPDTLGHGTFVAGQIFAKSNNEVGIAGIVPEVHVMPIKVFETSSTSTTTIVNAIYEAIDADVDVINMSLGGESTSATLKAACESAVEKNIIVVASAGNDGKSTPNYPAAYDCVVGVSSLDSDGSPSYFTQYGKSVYVAAPGAKVWSTYIDNETSYRYWSGTSFSGPEVAALAAMSRSVFADFSPSDFMTMLQETSVDKGAEGFDDYYGYGLINFKNASEYLLERAYVPIYSLSFDVKTKAGKEIDDATIKLEAAEDIVWEDDEEAGVEAGSWDEGYVVEPDEDGSYSLHKGKYKYTVSRDGYYTKTGTITTYIATQTEKVALEESYDVNIEVEDSEGDKIDEATISLTRKSDGLEEILEQNSESKYQSKLPAGKYDCEVSAEGYENSKAVLEIGNEAFADTIILYTSGEVNNVDFEVLHDTGEDVSTDEIETIDNATVTVTDGDGKTILAKAGNSYQLIRGEKYIYSVTAPGYESETGKLKVTDESSSTVTVAMASANYYLVFMPKDSEGNELSEAEVTVNDKDGNPVDPIKADANTYNLKKSSNATAYLYTINCDGYDTQNGAISVTQKYLEVSVKMSKKTKTVNVSAVDEDSSALEGVDITVSDGNGDLVIPKSENSYRLSEGEYSYTAYKEGYVAKNGAFEVDSNTSDVEISLEATEAGGDEGLGDSEGTDGDGSVAVTGFAGGSGTKEDPYLVATEEQLRSIGEATNLALSSNATRKDTVTTCYRLVSDIALDENNDWIPIGQYESDSNYAWFAGTFDGAGHTVSGVVVDKGSVNALGFFGAVRNATIKNLSVDGNVKSTGEYIGGLVGLVYYDADATTIKNCSFNGPVRGRYRVGGVVGYTAALTNSKICIYIENCCHTGGSVSAQPSYGDYTSANNIAGGIVGEARATRIKACYNDSEVRGYSVLGGIVGLSEENTYIYNVYNTGNINAKLDSTSVKGYVVGEFKGNQEGLYYFSKAGGASAAIGKTSVSTSPSPQGMVKSEMTNSSRFVGLLNILSGEISEDFVLTDTYPELAWRTYTRSKCSAEKPEIESISDDAEYALTDTASEITAKVNKPSDGGTLTYQWYKNDIKDTSMAEKIESTETSEADYEESSITPEIGEVGDTYYYVVVTNTYTDEEGNTAKNSVRSDYVKVSVASTNIAEVPEIESIEIVPGEDTVSDDTDEDVAGGDGTPGSTGDETNNDGDNGDAIGDGNNAGETGDNGDSSNIGDTDNNSEIGEVGNGNYLMGTDTNDKVVVSAKSTDGGTLSYQWYVSKFIDTKGNPVKGAVDSSCSIDTSVAGTYYYYVAITNSKLGDDGTTAKTKTKSTRIKVTVLDPDAIAADKVSELIESIGDLSNISLDDRDAIEKAREAYDAYQLLSDEAKAIIGETINIEEIEKALSDLIYEDDKATATPDKIESISAKVASYQSVALTWTHSSKATSYAVYRATSSNGNYEEVAQMSENDILANALDASGKSIDATDASLDSVATVRFVDSGLKTGTTYYYKVAPQVSFVRSGSDSSELEILQGAKSATVSAKPYLAKTTVKLKAGKKKATVSWTKVSGASGYVVYRSTKKSSGFKAIKTVKSGSTVKYTNKKLKKGKRYYYKVKAYRTVSGKKVYSEYSAVKSVKAK